MFIDIRINNNCFYEFLLKEVLRGLFNNLGSTVSWLNLAKKSSVQYHVTIASAVEKLEKMFTIKIFHNLDLNQKNLI